MGWYMERFWWYLFCEMFEFECININILNIWIEGGELLWFISCVLGLIDKLKFVLLLGLMFLFLIELKRFKGMGREGGKVFYLILGFFCFWIEKL